MSRSRLLETACGSTRKKKAKGSTRSQRASSDSSGTRNGHSIRQIKAQGRLGIRQEYNLLSQKMVSRSSKIQEAQEAQWIGGYRVRGRLRRRSWQAREISFWKGPTGYLRRLHFCFLQQMLPRVARRIHSLHTSDEHRRAHRRGQGIARVSKTSLNTMSNVRFSSTKNSWMQPHDMLQM